MAIYYDTSPLPYKEGYYNISVAISGNGKVSGGNVSIKAGESITLKATPDEGWLFQSFSNSIGTANIINEEYTFTPTDHTTIYATFIEEVSEDNSISSTTSELIKGYNGIIEGRIITTEYEATDDYLIGWYVAGIWFPNRDRFTSSISGAVSSKRTAVLRITTNNGYVECFNYLTDGLIRPVFKKRSECSSIIKSTTGSGKIVWSPGCVEGEYNSVITMKGSITQKASAEESVYLSYDDNNFQPIYNIYKDGSAERLEEGAEVSPYIIYAMPSVWGGTYDSKGLTTLSEYGVRKLSESERTVRYESGSNYERWIIWDYQYGPFVILKDSGSVEEFKVIGDVGLGGSVSGFGIYKAGTVCTLKATAATGYKFVSFVIDGEVIESPDYSFQVNKDTTVQVNFEEGTDEDLVTITVVNDPELGGTTKINGLSTNPLKVNVGSVNTITTTVNDGYYLFGIYQDGEFKTLNNSYTFNVGNKDRKFTIKFKSKDEGPYDKGDNSGTGGGDGTFDDSSDNPNDEINPPTMVDALLTIYSPTEAQITELGQYLYSDSAKGLAKNLLDYFGSLGTADLTAYIINTYQLPITIPTSGTKQVECGWYPTSVSMNVASGTAIEVGMGTCEVPAYYGNALDYKSRIQIYLPYVGFQDLDPAEVIGKTLGLKYFVDLITGDCVAKIYINDVIYYQFKGAMASPIPLGKDNFTDMIQQGINIGTGAITAGMSVSGATGAIAQGTSMHNFAIEQANAGTIYPEQFTASQQLIEEGTSRIPQAQMSLEQLQNKLSTAINTGTNVPHGTNAGGNMGWYMNQTPYIIIVRPNLSMPENYGHYHGYPSNITSKIGDLSGYTEFSAIHLEGLTATSNELAELEKILKGGIRIEN